MSMFYTQITHICAQGIFDGVVVTSEYLHAQGSQYGRDYRYNLSFKDYEGLYECGLRVTLRILH